MSDLKDMKTMAEWCRAEGRVYNTIAKRRAIAQVGTCIPPGTWLLTRKEWETVKRTPLAGCTGIRD